MQGLCAKFASVLGVVFPYLRLTPLSPLHTTAVWDPYIHAFSLFGLLYMLLPNVKIYMSLFLAPPSPPNCFFSIQLVSHFPYVCSLLDQDA